MAATKLPSMNFNLGPATKVETQNALKIKNQASPPEPSKQKVNKYIGMSDAAIKKAYIGMTQAQKKANGIEMAKASQANKKKKSTASSSSKTTPTSKPPTPKPSAAKPSAAKPTNKGDGSVKAVKKKTTFEQQQQYQASRKTRKGEERVAKDAKGNVVRQRWDGEKWVTKKVKGKG